MKKLIIAIVLWLSACGAALPTVIAGLSTAAEIFDLVETTLSPQYDDAYDVCAEQIAILSMGSNDLTTVVAACDELTDAWLAVLSSVNQLKAAQKTDLKVYEQDAVEEAKRRIQEYNDSYIKYEWAMK